MQQDNEDRWFVKGPSPDSEFGYFGGTLAPNSRYATKQQAEHVAHMCNLAYRAGELAARRKIQKALGLNGS